MKERATNLRISSSMMTGKAILKTASHSEKVRGVNSKIVCGTQSNIYATSACECLKSACTYNVNANVAEA